MRCTMKRLKYWVLGLSIRKKLIFYSYVIITPILLLVSVLLFLYNYNLAQEAEEETCYQSVLGLSDSIEVMQTRIMEFGTYICINHDITRILSAQDPTEINRDSQLWLHDAPMKIIQDMVALNGQIKTVAIYPENGVNPYLRSIDFSAHIADIEEVRKQKVYALAAGEKGKMIWQRVGKYKSDTYEMNRNDKIVMYREIYDLARKNRRGFLVIGAQADKFDELARNSLRSDAEAVVVVSEYGAQLLCVGNVPKKRISEIIKEEQEKPVDGRTVSTDSEYADYHVYRCRSEETGTVVYKLVPKSGILSSLGSVVYTPLAFLIGFLVGLYPIMILVSNIVSKPLHSLCAAMEKFKRGDFGQKVEVITSDEVGEASACFNGMVDDIKELIDKNYVMALKERESELDVLQAQINPHFLYNTLDTLYWRVLEDGNEEAAEDILTLSQLFRLVLNRGNSIVSVRSEGELLERYLHIQKMRFGKRLEYKVSMSEAILEREIPKLILQPFVENAIVHGFEKVGDLFHLSVSGEEDGNHMVFYIRDTGVGMNKEQLAAIFVEPDTREYASQRIGRYAIKNVRERLELMYGEDFELRIESEEGRGTTVMIRIPCGLKELQIDERETINRR